MLNLTLSYKYEDLITFFATKVDPETGLFEDKNVFSNLELVTQLWWFIHYGVIATWLNKYTVPFSFVLTRWGICFNFNMIASSELYYKNETSFEFHHSPGIILKPYIPSLDAYTYDLNQSFPWSVSNNRRFLIIYFKDQYYQEMNPFIERQGYHLIFHSNYEMPFEDEKNHIRVASDEFVTIDIKPIVHTADDSLHELEINE